MGKKGKNKKGLLKKWWFWVIIIVVGIGALSTGGNKTDKDSNSDKPVVNQDDKAKEVTYNIGDSFETGKLGVVIEAAEEKTEFVSENQFVKNVTTEGKFIVVTAKLTNNDKETRTFSSMQFKLVDNQDRKFEALTSAELMMILGDKNLFLESCNPGMSRTGIFVFEVPSDIETYSIEVAGGVGFAGGKSEIVKLK